MFQGDGWGSGHLIASHTSIHAHRHFLSLLRSPNVTQHDLVTSHFVDSRWIEKSRQVVYDRLIFDSKCAMCKNGWFFTSEIRFTDISTIFCGARVSDMKTAAVEHVINKVESVRGDIMVVWHCHWNKLLPSSILGSWFLSANTIPSRTVLKLPYVMTQDVFHHWTPKRERPIKTREQGRVITSDDFWWLWLGTGWAPLQYIKRWWSRVYEILSHCNQLLFIWNVTYLS